MGKAALTLSICSFSVANSDTDPKTSLNSLRYKLDLSIEDEPISSSLTSKYSTSIVANVAEVVTLARNELATICSA